MRDWIAVIVAVLGVLLVLAGGVLIVLQALGDRSAAPVPVAPVPDNPDNADTVVVAAPAPAPAPLTSRLLGVVKSPTPADRLIFWGIILLVLSAIAAGAITFELGAKGGGS
ncbi:hypothetical protein [Dactylosporangium sp. CA-233914]|uniref:hypothetical protein n=1 Tax=Dactylosporangium sp. CA-233914 TaxID=3239934 RepID=UPI003D903174